MACFHPITVKNPQTGQYIQVACGHCIGCQKKMQDDWVLRLVNEFESEPTRPAVFATLTYNDENLPTEEFNKEGTMYENPSVCQRDCQLFFKRLRKACESKKNKEKYPFKIKYFLTSEYGPHTKRPHYHAIIYGLSKKDYDLINEAWGLGFIYLGDCTKKSITYTCKYCAKPTECTTNRRRDAKGYFDNAKWMDEMGIRRKEFRLMSKNLGAAYAKDEKNLRFHLSEPLYHHYVRFSGFKRSMPRYWTERIYNNIEAIKKFSKDNVGISGNLQSLISNHMYWDMLASYRAKYASSEDYIQRDIEDTKTREDILLQNRIRFLDRSIF